MREVKALIVSANFYAEISEHLEGDAETTLQEQSKAQCSIQRVPGVFEIPTVVAMYHEKFDLVVALGAVIRGETSHYDLITQSVTNALQTLAWQKQIALGFGIITAENRNQAMARAIAEGKHRVGRRAAEAAIRLMEAREKVR